MPRAAKPAETTLDDNVEELSTVAPGDAPADTTDPTEHASTVVPQPSAEALKQGTVNGVLPVEPATTAPAAAVDAKDHRVEEYDAVKPDGSKVRIKHNIDLGTTEIVK
ncbi:hypothetical protein [Leifsonia sp. 71-9]|uniref:hypothetical protein n=1 Tax=Leifsonia sp. 71-9 TaxID=1895934 RepID=UPI00092B41B3|nr:hypothetical protein [Leifsonia sp. 71-9]OJX72825.1 MAG: hypothetical protein BGO91_13735 [Leifsonia sp. 71-9]